MTCSNQQAVQKIHILYHPIYLKNYKNFVSIEIPVPCFYFLLFKLFFCLNVCISINLRVQISNVIRFISSFSPKISKWGSFGPTFKNFYFYVKVCIVTNSWALISSMTIAFSNFSPKIPNSGIYTNNFCFHET